MVEQTTASESKPQNRFQRSTEIKFDASLLPPTDDPSEILKQVEFYFSDANLPRDKFLWTLTQSDPLHQGWVQISTIASFKRMQRFKSIDNIVAALRQSNDLLEVNEEGTAVRRKPPLLKPSEKEFHELNERSVYVKGFGEETPSLQIDLEKYFKEFGEIDSIRLRRTDKGLFKGSVIVQFKSQSDADKFLAEPREWDGNLLDQKSKTAWIQGKKAEDEKLTWDERRERDKTRHKQAAKHFSAYKEMEKQQNRKGNATKQKTRRFGTNRNPSDQPIKTEETAADESVMRKESHFPSKVEEAPSLFSIKREAVDTVQTGKRAAEEDLNGEEPKKAKINEP